MGRRPGPVKGITVHAYNSPCAHLCRYCSIGDRTFTSVSNERLFRFLDRLIAWRDSAGRSEITVQIGFPGPSYNFDPPDLQRLVDFFERSNGHRLHRIPLGGLKRREPDALRAWLSERRDIGFDSIAASMAGHGAVHDAWNGRSGDFELMLTTQRTARDLGMELHQGFFLAKSTLPILDDAVSILDAALGPPTKRYARVFMGAGYGAHHGPQRIEEEDRPNIPQWARDLVTEDDLRSEREWIPRIRAAAEGEHEVHLQIDVTDDTIDALERGEVPALIEDLTLRTRRAVTAMPSAEELLDTVADTDARAIFAGVFDLKRAWLDRYVERTGLSLEWPLVRHSFGKAIARRPPKLALTS